MVSVAAALLSNRHEPTEITQDVILEVVFSFICDHDVGLLSGKTRSSDPDDPHPAKKQKQINYDRERAKKCVTDDWLGPILRFPDKSFECTFCIKQEMVHTIMNHLQSARVSGDRQYVELDSHQSVPMSSFFVPRRCYAMEFLPVPSSIISKWERPHQEDVYQN
jgi:hypothetical protein